MACILHARLVPATATAVLALALSGCSGPPANGENTAKAAPAPVVVIVKNMTFTPADITVKPGQEVVWKFQDGGVPHDVVGDDGLKSQLLTSGSYRHTFKKAGTYRYTCTVHTAMMNGTVTVR